MKKIFMAIASVVLACGIGVAAVGCGASFDAEGAINVYNREDGSGTRDAFIELIGIEKGDLIKGVAEHSSTGAVLNAVADDPQGIGYISLGSLDDSVKALEIDGVYPTEATVQDGSYAVSRPFELMYQEENDSDLLADFLVYLKSTDAQEIIADDGYVTLGGETTAYTAHDGAFTDSDGLVIGGSTSVQPLMIKLTEDYKAKCGQTVTLTVQGGGSGTGISSAANGTFDIGMASKEVSQSDFESPTGTMVVETLCNDGIAVIVSTQNPLEGLATTDLADIYTGKVTAWSAYVETQE